MAVQLVSATEDANHQAVLSFQWDAFAPTSGLTSTGYQATLWADAARSAAIAGGMARTATGTATTFSAVPRGLPFLLDITAIDTAGGLGPTVSLLQVAPSAILPGLPLPAGQSGAGSGEGEDNADGVLSPLRPVYGTVDGVKRWARVVSFGDGRGQVSALDVLYFLMIASDDADGEFAQRYAVPLTRYRDAATGLFRYPPPLPGLIERKAAGLLLYSRKAALTETESGTAVGLMTYADKKIAALAANAYLLGQTQTSGVRPRVHNAVPRSFTMPGDPAGLAFTPTAPRGTTDVRSLRQHALSYSSYGWQSGSGQGWGDF